MEPDTNKSNRFEVSENVDNFSVNFQNSCDYYKRKSVSFGVNSQVNEKSVLLSGKRDQKVKFDANSSFFQSSHVLTQSSILGFNSATVARIGQKDFEASKTVSLVHIPSDDRRISNIIFFFSSQSMITSLSVYALPFLTAHYGVTALVMIAVIGALMCYTCMLINECQYQVSQDGIKKRVYQSYVDMGSDCISWHGETIMKFFVASNVMSDIYILIFCSQITVDLLRNVVHFDKRIWAVLWICAAFPLFFIPRMSILSWFGFFSLGFFVVGTILAFVLMVTKWQEWTYQHMNPTFSINHFFIGFGIIINSYNLHLAIPVMEATMIHPEKYKVITCASYGVCTVIKVIFSSVGALSFGILTQGSVLSNFEGTAFAMTIPTLIAISMYLMYPTSVFVVFDMADNFLLPKLPYFNKSTNKRKLWIFISRFLTTGFILIVTVCVPNFEMVTSFVGNVRGTFITIILPVYFYLKIRRRHLSRFSKIFHWMLIIVSFVFGFAGASFAIYGIVKG
ncbi:vesicular GABA transporter-like isoform X1 [Hydra vulgaris]|uniref:vesicular GABA transporter-like isoform X1 n=1 Tax=Hydra vulgaris TaxID=6087 RepID=UPI001F5EC76B|nr:vesicular GABA transporter-like [Hydra vulgaris]